MAYTSTLCHHYNSDWCIWSPRLWCCVCKPLTSVEVALRMATTQHNGRGTCAHSTQLCSMGSKTCTKVSTIPVWQPKSSYCTQQKCMQRQAGHGATEDPNISCCPLWHHRLPGNQHHICVNIQVHSGMCLLKLTPVLLGCILISVLVVTSLVLSTYELNLFYFPWLHIFYTQVVLF